MREILFRGKRKDNGVWVEGYLIRAYIEKYVIQFEYDEIIYNVEVIPETIGQFTGLTDKNGNKIFEGDIVEETWDWSCYVNKKFIVKFVPHRGGWYPFANGDGCGCCEENTIAPSDNGEVYVRIIGNIHDNPEFLEEKK